MLILQASATENRLVIWGETAPTQTGEGSSKAQGEPVAVQGPVHGSRSRFAVDRSRLVKVLSEEIPDFKAKAGEVQGWVAWLPSTSYGALPSSRLLAELPGETGKVRLAPWDMPALELTPAQALAVLQACVGRTTWGPGVVIGTTLGYWAGVLRWAGAIIARQQYIPCIRAEGDGKAFRACWEPVLMGEDRIRAEHLARNMPHACRALGLDANNAPTAAASRLLGDVLTSLVDQLVRGVHEDPGKKASRRFTSEHDQWLHALRAPDGRLLGAQEELAALAEQVDQWRRPLDLAAGAPFRLCLKLEEPDVDAGADPDRWSVRYLLQAVDNPTLLVPAQAVWTGKGPDAGALNVRGFRPREYLLSALGQAARVCPRIEASLKSSAPLGYELNATSAHEFLAERAEALEQAGFGTLLPEWWTRKGSAVRLSARAVVSAPTVENKNDLSLDSLLNFHWQVALGDHVLTLPELKALARLKKPLVRVRDQWVVLNPREIQDALAVWKTKGDTAIRARDAVQLALGASRAPGSLKFAGVEASGWLAELLGQLESATGFEALDPPKGFQGELRPYQERGYSWLSFLRRWGLGACLADDMGLGKTVQTLALIQYLWENTEPSERRPTLLICPMSVVSNWKKEAARFTPELTVMIHHGLDRARGAEFRENAQQHALVLTSYALLHRDFDHFNEVPWSCMILDEAQNVKNPLTKQAQAARSLNAGHRIALTGTPVENHVGDLWSIMEFLNPGWLGNQTEFKRTFQLPIQAQRDPLASRQLQRLTAPFILRRIKTDKSIIADLPDKLETKVFCTLTSEQASLYTAVVNSTSSLIDTATGIQRKGLVLATLMKLKQVCNHPAHYLRDRSALAGRSGKLSRLTEMLEEALSAGDRALVFTQFAEMGALLKDHLQEMFGQEVLFLHGATPKSQRDRMVEQFQSESSTAPPIFILSLRAGGTGLNLTAANHVFHFDRWWNPAVENQATDRAFRIGQTRRVQVHKFVCAGTLEERIDAMIEEKIELADAIVDSSEAWLTRLSNTELKALLTLREEALGV